MEKKNNSVTTFALALLFALSLSLPWNIISRIQPSAQGYRFFPFVQSLFLAGYTWTSIVVTNDIYIFNSLVETDTRKKKWIEKIAYFCSILILCPPALIMRLIDVVFNNKKSNEKIDYSNRLKETLDNLSTKPLIVRAFAIPAAVILIFNMLFVVKVLPEVLIPIAQSILDALVSLVGFTFILANAKQKQNASN